MTTLEQIDERLAIVERGLATVQTRSSTVETGLAAVGKRVAVVEAQIKHPATKADVANVKFDLLKWLVPIILGQTAAIFAIAEIWGG